MVYISEIRQVFRRIFSWRQTGSFLILTIGLTLATVMFTIGHGYSSVSLPYKDAEQLVVIGNIIGNRFPQILDARLFFEWKEQNSLFTDIAIFSGRDRWRIRTENGNKIISGIKASGNFFDVLGISFPGIEEWKRSAGTEHLDTPVFTHKIGMKEFGYSGIGRLYRTMDGGGVIVGGILPENFALPSENMGGNTSESGIVAVPENAITGGTVIARLAPGITPQIAEEALTARFQEDEAALFQERLVVKPLREIMTESSFSIVWSSWALCGLVLVLCSANLSGILLVRCSYQLREYAIRTAFGARFFDLLRLLLIELTVISAIAAFLAYIAGRVIVAAVGNAVPVKYLSFGRPVFGLETTVFLIAGAITVMILSAAASIAVIGRNYRRGFSIGQMTAFYSHRWMRMMLTAGQTAIAMLLLSVSYVAVRGYLDIFNRDVGVDAITRIVSVQHSPMLSENARKNTIHDILDTFRGGDAERAVAAFFGTLFDDRSAMIFFPDPVGKFVKPGEVTSSFVSPGFFRTAKVKILAGREFNDQDADDAVLIGASFARRMGWTQTEPFEQLLGSHGVTVGVVDDFLFTAWDRDAPLIFFRPLNPQSESSWSRGGINYIIHPDALSRVGNVERIIMRADPDAVITRNVKWSELLGESVRGRTIATICVALFAIAAIVIVVTGIANTVMFIIARRTRDIAIHVAVGAQARHVCWFVTRDMVMAGIAGIVIGGLASWWAGKTVAHLIYHGDRYQNLPGLTWTALAMIVVIVCASLIPALRALRIEPGLALKLE